MRWRLLIAVVSVAASSATEAQVRTRCTNLDGRTTECRTTGTETPVSVADYAGGLMAGEASVPKHQDNRLANEQIEQLRIRNQLKRRELERQDAPGYDRTRCRRSAAAALNADDLILARDVLIACGGSE